MSWYIENFPWTVDDRFCVIASCGTPVHTNILVHTLDGFTYTRRAIKPSFHDVSSPQVWSWRSVKR